MSLHYMLMSNHLLLQRKFFLKIKESGLSSGQPKILEFLSDHNGAIQKDIAEGCHIEPASLTSILAGMEKAGLVTRNTDPANRRNLHVFITPKGQEKLTEIQQVFREIDAAALAGFSQEQKDQILGFLQKIYSNLKDCV